jgi:hypothetical protein
VRAPLHKRHWRVQAIERPTRLVRCPFKSDIPYHRRAGHPATPASATRITGMRIRAILMLTTGRMIHSPATARPATAYSKDSVSTPPESGECRWATEYAMATRVI